jgi:hypothetical protein
VGDATVVPLDDPAERLFRSIEQGWTDGDQITVDAIDLAGSSCNRERLAPDPASAIDPLRRPRENGVAAIAVQDAHGHVERDEGEPWEFYPQHLPEPENSAHCEIRVHRKGSANATDRIKSQEQKRKVKDEIAKRMRIVLRPTSIGTAPHEDEFG